MVMGCRSRCTVPYLVQSIHLLCGCCDDMQTQQPHIKFSPRTSISPLSEKLCNINDKGLKWIYKPQCTQISSVYLPCCPCASIDEGHTLENIHSFCLLCLRLVTADSLLKQPGWSEQNMWELIMGEDNLSKTLRRTLSPPDSVFHWSSVSIGRTALHENRDWLFLISSWLGMHFGIWDAFECSLCGRNRSWEDKVNRKKFQNTGTSEKGTSISFASMYFYFSF